MKVEEIQINKLKIKPASYAKGRKKILLTTVKPSLEVMSWFVPDICTLTFFSVSCGRGRY